jgi:chromosome segregation ATPase
LYPSSRKGGALSALATAQAELDKAKAALSTALSELGASGESLTRLRETLAKAQTDLDALQTQYDLLAMASTAQAIKLSELERSLKASRAETKTATDWAAGLGLGMLLAVLGWIFL